MFELLTELINFITFNEVVQAAAFDSGGEGSGRSYLATGISLALKKSLSIVILVAAFILLAAIPFLFLADLGLFGVRASQQAKMIIARILTGLPIFGLVLITASVFINIFINRVEMSTDNRNNIKCILDNSKCSSNGSFNSSQVRIDSALTTGIEFINIFAGIVTALGIIGFITAGFLYITSAGEAKRVESAKSLFKYTGIGIIIALSLFSIVGLLSNVFMTI